VSFEGQPALKPFHRSPQARGRHQGCFSFGFLQACPAAAASARDSARGCGAHQPGRRVAGCGLVGIEQPLQACMFAKPSPGITTCRAALSTGAVKLTGAAPCPRWTVTLQIGPRRWRGGAAEERSGCWPFIASPSRQFRSKIGGWPGQSWARAARRRRAAPRSGLSRAVGTG